VLLVGSSIAALRFFAVPPISFFLIHVPRSLPTPVLAALRRLATFPNPVFHEKLWLRFPTFDTPRFLFAGEWHADRFVLPRGV